MIKLAQKTGSLLPGRMKDKPGEARSEPIRAEIPVAAGSQIIAMQVDAEVLSLISHTLGSLFHGGFYGKPLPPAADVVQAGKTGPELAKSSLIQLEHLTYSPDTQTRMAWNAVLTQIALEKLPPLPAGENRGFSCLAAPSGKEMAITDGEGNVLLMLTLLAPGEGENNGGAGWAISFEQVQPLPDSLNTLLYNGAPLLPLFADTIDPEGARFPQALGISLTESGPKAQFSSNLLILDMIGSSLISSGAGNALADLAHKAAFDDRDVLDAGIGEISKTIQRASVHIAENAIKTAQQGVVLDLIGAAVNSDFGAEVKAFIQTDPRMFSVPRDTKDELCKAVDKWLNFSKASLPAEGAADSRGSLHTEFGPDGPAGGHALAPGRESLHSGFALAPVGWSVAGVQAMLDMMNIRAARYQDCRLQVSAAPGDNSYPPQKLLVTAGDAAIMTLQIERSASGEYTYAIRQNTGLLHKGGNLLSAMLNPAEGDGASLSHPVVDMILDGLEASLGSFGSSVMNAFGNTLRTVLEQSLSAEKLAEALGSGNLLHLPLPYITVDSDGDMAANLAFHTVKDSVPVIGGRPDPLPAEDADPGKTLPEAPGANHLTSLAGPPDEDSPFAEGSLTINAFDGIEKIVVDDTVLWDAGASVQAVAGKYGEFSVISIVDNGEGLHTLTYAYKQLPKAEAVFPPPENGNPPALVQPGPADHFTLTVVDGDGDDASTGISLQPAVTVPLESVPGGFENKASGTAGGIRSLPEAAGDALLSGAGSSEICENGGADAFSRTLASMTPGKDGIMVFSAGEGDRLCFDELLSEGQSLDAFLLGEIGKTALDGDAASFSLKVDGVEKAREAHGSAQEEQSPEYGAFAALCSADGLMEQECLAAQFIKGICE